MADDTEVLEMQADSTSDDPDEVHVFWQRQRLTKEQALDGLNSLIDRKAAQKVSDPDPEQRTQAGVSEEAAEHVRSQLSPRKTDALADDPFDADEAFDEKVNELRARVESQREG